MSKQMKFIISVLAIIGCVVVMTYTSYNYYHAYRNYKLIANGSESTLFNVLAFMVTLMQLFILSLGCYCIKEVYKDRDSK